MNQSMITINSVDKSFHGRKVIDGLTFTVNKGEIVGFLGPNGSGKTTTIRLLNGVLAPDAGQIKVGGLDPGIAGEEIRRRSGVMTESAGLYRNLTGKENLAFFAQLYGVKNPEIRIRELVTDFGLAGYFNQKVGTYSTGMKKRLGIAKALLHSPELLFLDEPTSGLDPEGTRDLISYISMLNCKYQVTIFLCTHLLKQVQDLCHQFIFIANGRVLEQGTLKTIEHKYLGEIDLKIETELPVCGNNFKGYPIVNQEPGSVTLRIPNKTQIPEVLKAILADAPVFSAEIIGRDLETLYFKVKEAAK